MKIEEEKFKLLIALGKEQRYLTIEQLNDYLPDADTEQLEDLMLTLSEDLHIPVVEEAPAEDEALLADPQVANDEEVEEEAAAALAALNELGRTTDPVRMYMREMGSVELLTREGEIVIAIRIEEGIREVMRLVASYPPLVGYLLEQFVKVQSGESRLVDFLIGFIDVSADHPVVAPEAVGAEEIDLAADDEEESAGAVVTDEADAGPIHSKRKNVLRLFKHCIQNISKLGKLMVLMIHARKCYSWKWRMCLKLRNWCRNNLMT